MAKVFPAPKTPGYHSVIDAKTCPELEHCQLGLLDLKAGQSYHGQTGHHEWALVVLEGSVRISVGETTWDHVGQRKNVFDGKAASVYVPIDSEYTVEALTENAKVAVAGVKAEEKHAPFLISEDEVLAQHRGKKTWQRDVYDIIGDNGDGRVHRIVIGETYGDAGAWSSYPPHKHDEVRDGETSMEEVYLFQLDPVNGFAIQLLYTEDRSIDEAHIVRQGDSFGIKKGYHPVVSAGGYRVYYLWFMGGAHGRRLMPYTEQQHRWLDA